MNKKYLLITPLIILFLLVIIIFFALYKKSVTNDIEAKLNSGKVVMMPQFSLPDLYDENKTFSNSDLKGHFSLINVFASWCVSCLAEHKTLLKISADKSVKIYGVAWRDFNQNTKDYIEKNGNPYQKVGVDSKGIFSKLLFVSGTPESFLIDPSGRIIKYWKGRIGE